MTDSVDSLPRHKDDFGRYLLVDMTLARPEADAGNPPISRLRGGYD